MNSVHGAVVHQGQCRPVKLRGNSRARNVLLVGAGGGVGTAVLGLFARHPAGIDLRRRLGTIFLLDGETSPPSELVPSGSVLLSPEWIRSGGDLSRVLQRHGIGEVIELAEIDTLDCIEASGQYGTKFLCTGLDVRPELQNSPGAIPCGAMVRAQELQSGSPPDLSNGSFLVGSGMNPGIVNSLVEQAVEQFMVRAGVPNLEALELGAIYFTEEDTTRETHAEPPDPSVFPMTWSPGHCLWELLEPSTAIMRHGRVLFLGHPPYEHLYRARCGDGTIEGMIVPHEEVVTIGARYPWAEAAYLYRLLPAAFEAIRNHPDRCYDDWVQRKLYPPNARPTKGVDRVGVLLCSRRHGELWMGYETDARQAAPYGTNATLLQVAAGVVSGWWQLGEHGGVHFVEELDSNRFLDVATSILGRPRVVFDQDASFRPLELRRVGREREVVAHCGHRSDAAREPRTVCQASAATVAR